MWKTAFRALYFFIFLGFSAYIHAQNLKNVDYELSIHFRYSENMDSLFFEEHILFGDSVPPLILFKQKARSKTKSEFLSNTKLVITDYQSDAKVRELPENEFYALKIPQKSKRVLLKGFYTHMKNPLSSNLHITEQHIPHPDVFDDRNGALKDYLKFGKLIHNDIQIQLDCPIFYALNGLPYQKTYTLQHAGEEDVQLILHPEIEKFSTSVQIGPSRYTLTILGNKHEVSPEKFQEIQRLTIWMHEHYGKAPNENILLELTDFKQNIMDEKGFNYYEKYLNTLLIEKLSQHWLSGIQFSDKYDIAWFKNGFSRYNQWLFLEEFGLDQDFIYPYEKSQFARFFDISHFDFSDILLYEYWINAKIREDISPNDDIRYFSHLNYKSLTYGKAALMWKHLAEYQGVKSVDMFIQSCIREESALNIPHQLNSHFGKENAWFYDAIYNKPTYDDWFIASSESNGDSLNITIKNRGDGSLPLKLKFIASNDSLEIWLPPFLREHALTVKDKNWQKIQIDPEKSLVEINKRNNQHSIDKSRLFQNVGKLRIQPIISVFNTEKRQIFLYPSFRWNNYDKSILGISFNNRTFPIANTSYRIVPEYSTSTGKILGNLGIKTNYYPKESPIQRVEFGTFYKKNHYDFDLEVQRFTAGIKMFLSRKHLADSRNRFFHFRTIKIDAEQSPDIISNQPESYSVFALRYHQENRKSDKPYFLNTEIQSSKDFRKIQSDYLIQFNLLNNKKNNSLRFFAAKLFESESFDEQAYYAIGLSESPDYLFENLLLGRSDNSGIWSRQFFVSDGGFKTDIPANIESFLISSNLELNLWKNLGIYSDIALADALDSRVYWDSGVNLKLVNEFLELYFPVISSEKTEIRQAAYFDQVRFVLNLDVEDMLSKFRESF